MYIVFPLKSILCKNKVEEWLKGHCWFKLTHSDNAFWILYHEAFLFIQIHFFPPSISLADLEFAAETFACQSCYSVLLKHLVSAVSSRGRVVALVQWLVWAGGSAMKGQWNQWSAKCSRTKQAKRVMIFWIKFPQWFGIFFSSRADKSINHCFMV